MMNPNFSSLYEIVKIDQVDENHLVAIKINPNHEVFRGHFPDKPILPGVCQMEMIREISEHLLQEKLFLSEVAHIKFLKMIDPALDTEFQVQIALSHQENNYNFSALVRNENGDFLKIKGILQK